MKNYIRAVLGLTIAYQKRFLRDKTALFFTFLIPLIFLLCFGFIFNGGDISFKIAVVNNSDSEFAKQFVDKTLSEVKTFDVSRDESDIASAKQKMSRGEVDSIVELLSDFGTPNQQGIPSGAMNVYYQKGSEQSGRTIAAIMQQVLDAVNKQLGRPDAALTVNAKSTDSSGLSEFDYTFSGLLGFAIVSMGIFGLSSFMPQEKQRGAFRRLRASPFRAGQLIMANALHYLIITLLSVIAVVVMGILIFKFNMRGDWFVFGLYAVISSIMILGIGLFIGAWAKNENQSAPISNLITFPMMFLSGVFFPRYLYPEWLRGITDFVPLTPVVDGFRRIMTENVSLAQLGPELAVIGVWIAVVYIAAIKLFRWE